jgi:hypothetical protein
LQGHQIIKKSLDQDYQSVRIMNMDSEIA